MKVRQIRSIYETLAVGKRDLPIGSDFRNAGIVNAILAGIVVLRQLLDVLPTTCRKSSFTPNYNLLTDHRSRNEGLLVQTRQH